MQTAPAAVRNWLIVVAAMIFFMIVLGALTRLTESGLSMVEWRPVTGWLPPTSDASWQAELQKYLSSPQGRLINRDFGIAEFQQIFWLEFIHRLWGRLIGVVLATMTVTYAGHVMPSLHGLRIALLISAGVAALAAVVALTLPTPAAAAAEEWSDELELEGDPVRG